MPLPKKTKAFDFAAIGAPELKCTIIDPKSLKYGRLRQLIAGSGNDEGRGVELVTELVVDWNLTDDDGKPLPLPKDKPEVLDELTIEVIELIARQIMEGIQPPKN
jgi:hypothetical protein